MPDTLVAPAPPPTAATPPRVPAVAARRSRTALARRVVLLVLLAVADVIVLLSIGSLFGEGTWFVGAAVVVLLVGTNAVLILRRRLQAWRWLGPGLAALLMLTVAPVVYTLYIAFTNYDADHLLTEDQAVRVIELDTYLPRGEQLYDWRAYGAPGADQVLVLKAPDGSLLQVGQGTAARPISGSGFPARVDGQAALSTRDTVRDLTALAATDFGPVDRPIRIQAIGQAGRFEPIARYDRANGTMVDTRDGKVYRPVQGTFTASDGSTLAPSFRAGVGLANVGRLVGDAEIRGPALSIFIWTIVFAVLVVFSQFVLGLLMAVVLGDSTIPRRLAKAIRSFLLLPYVIPGYLSILVWAALLNQNLGVVPLAAHTVLGIDPTWWGTAAGARFSVLLVAFWLGFPYFLLISSGALQAVPADLLEAASTDGAGPVRRFFSVTLPILLRMVSPLIVLGLAYNFNNFLVVYLLTQGGPTKAGTTTPAGDSDLLISYTYKLAFDFGRNDYALAAVITMFIFAILVPIVVSQFRYYKVWSEED